VVNTQIGQGMRGSRFRAPLAVAVAATAVAADFVLVLLQAGTDANRMLLALLSLSVLFLITRDRGRSLGLVLRLHPNYVYWAKAAVAIGAVVGVFCAIAAIVIWKLGIPAEMPRAAPESVPSRLVHMCVVAPFLEETLYRVVLCAPLAAVVGTRWTIFLAGAVFAGLHFAYGNPGPDNFIAGFFLAWAYLKSGSIVTPIVLHSMGNGVALAAQVVAWWTCT